MAKSKKATAVQRIIIIGSILITLQIVYLFIFSGEEPITERDAINKQIDALNRPPREKEIKRILAAVHSYRVKNGKFPGSLTELTPTYFDRIPIDPETNQTFKYWLENNTPYVGEKVTMASAGGTKTQQEALIASLTEDTERASFVYDATGKRDPFRPFNLAPKVGEGAGRTPLEKYAIGQLKLTAILGHGDQASAMVEDAQGKGFSVRKGTKIGTNGGEVIEILPDRLLILETTVDFTGQSKTRNIEMRIRTKDQNSGGPSTDTSNSSTSPVITRPRR